MRVRVCFLASHPMFQDKELRMNEDADVLVLLPLKVKYYIISYFNPKVVSGCFLFFYKLLFFLFSVELLLSPLCCSAFLIFLSPVSPPYCSFICDANNNNK